MQKYEGAKRIGRCSDLGELSEGLFVQILLGAPLSSEIKVPLSSWDREGTFLSGKHCDLLRGEVEREK